MDFDPQGRGKQFAREARIGMTIIALLLAALVYTAIQRFSDTELPQQTDLRAEAREYFKNRPILPEQRPARDLINRKKSLDRTSTQQSSETKPAFRPTQSADTAIASIEGQRRTRTNRSSFASQQSRGHTTDGGSNRSASEGSPNGQGNSTADHAEDRADRHSGNHTAQSHSSETPRGAPEVICSKSTETRKIVVKQNDTFWNISQKVYGSGFFYRALHEFNRAQFPDINQLPAGKTVIAPPCSVLHSKYPNLIKASGRISQATFDQHETKLPFLTNNAITNVADGLLQPRTDSRTSLNSKSQPNPDGQDTVVRNEHAENYNPAATIVPARNHAGESRFAPLKPTPISETPILRSPSNFPRNDFQGQPQKNRDKHAPPEQTLPDAVSSNTIKETVSPKPNRTIELGLPPVRDLSVLETIKPVQEKSPPDAEIQAAVEFKLEPSERNDEQPADIASLAVVAHVQEDSELHSKTAITGLSLDDRTQTSKRAPDLPLMSEKPRSQFHDPSDAEELPSNQHDSLPVLAEDVAPNFAARRIARESNRSATGRVYVVRAGDNLFGIAGQQLSQASRYLEILELNRQQLPAEINHLTPLTAGTKLRLPLN